MFTIKQEGDKFVLYDDGLVCDTFDTQEAAARKQAELEQEEAIADAVSDALDAMLDNLKEKFPTVSSERIQELIASYLL